MYVYLLSIIMNDICWFWDNFLFKFLMEVEGVFVWVCLSVERVVGVIIFLRVLIYLKFFFYWVDFIIIIFIIIKLDLFIVLNLEIDID